MGCAAGCATEDRAERGDRRSAPPQAGSCRCLDHLGWDLWRVQEGSMQPLCGTPMRRFAPLDVLRLRRTNVEQMGGPKRPTPEEDCRMARYRFHCTNGSECFFDARGTDMTRSPRLAIRASKVAGG